MTCGTLVVHTSSSLCCLKALYVAVLRTKIVDYALTKTLPTPAVLCCCCDVLCCAVPSWLPCSLLAVKQANAADQILEDEAVQQLVLSATPPAVVMLGLGWNNSLDYQHPLCCAACLDRCCPTGTHSPPSSQRTRQCSSWYSAQHCLRQ
jgi:hypothetical protein